MNNTDDAKLKKIVSEVCATYSDGAAINLFDGFRLPHQQEIITLAEHLLEVVFPGYRRETDYSPAMLELSIGSLLGEIYGELTHLIADALRYQHHTGACRQCEINAAAREKALVLLEHVAPIRNVAKKDIAAAFDGDPAAMDLSEIVLSYPCIKTIVIQRFAHVLYCEQVPLVPRMMTEYAHSVTGIDIHPGARLGEGFFIDHGTGVVIGETAIIGNHVKLYQGVTLGALSFPKDACGRIIKGGGKRHPTIEDNVTIYAGATVLGDITVGHDSVLGGNVWVTESLPPQSKVTIRPDK